MEVSAIKQEPLFDDGHDVIINELMQCCYLCQDGQKIFKELHEHFRKIHFDDYNQLPNDSIIQLCSCPDSIQLQYKLLNHMLSKSLSPQSKIDSFPLIEQFKDEKIHIAENIDTIEQSIFENVKVEMNESESSEEQSEDSESSFGEELKKTTKAKRKRRKRVELAQCDGFKVKCDYCPRIFTKTQSLQNHYNLMHDPTNQFKCTKCNFGHCKTLRNLNSHLKSHDEEEIDSSALKDLKICPKCGKKWQTELQLYNHMMLHREKILECDHCGAKFNMKTTLRRHILIHFKKKKPKDKGKEKKTLCQHCSMWISFYNLKRHIRTSHSDNKHIYKCDFDGCGKSFTESQTLKDHKNLHLGVKPYVCEFCSMSFAHIATLRRHKYRHTEPEKYKCQICNECFVTRKSLTNHVQRQHEDVGNDAKPFACDYEGCNSTFKYENYLQNHKRDVHIRKRTRIRNKDKPGQRHDRIFGYNESLM